MVLPGYYLREVVEGAVHVLELGSRTALLYYHYYDYHHQ